MIGKWNLGQNHFKIFLYLAILLIFDVKLARAFDNEGIYILAYTNPDRPPFSKLLEENEYVKKKGCFHQNCFFYRNKTKPEELKNYDVLLFHVADLKELALPEERLENHRFIFVSDEPPTRYEVSPNYNEFFNLTWTYKLNSDITLRNLIVQMKNNNEVVGPAEELDSMDGLVHWIDVFNSNKPISDDIKNKLQKKTKAAAWFASDCHTSSKREEYVQKLNNELKKLNLNVDIYGKCGDKTCPQNSLKDCETLLQSDYYFYLAFESSLSEDYVTEELLIPLKNFAVPVVYGGASYNRFMPKGMYIDATSIKPAELATSINFYITNKEKYYDFFKWHNFYSYHYANESADTDEICAFCSYLNDHKFIFKTTVYTFIDKFWSSE